ncbi:MAG TPA: hypothetical protein VJL57_02950 [Candidatus Paceibacterota bacterium]
MRRIKHTGVLYRLAYFWHKPEEKPAERVYVCDTLGLAVWSLGRMVATALVVLVSAAFVFGMVVGAAKLIFSGFAATGSGALWLLGFTGLSAAANEMQTVPVIFAACIGLVAVAAVVGLTLFGISLFLAPIRELYVTGFRSLKERYCPVWEVV